MKPRFDRIERLGKFKDFDYTLKVPVPANNQPNSEAGHILQSALLVLQKSFRDDEPIHTVQLLGSYGPLPVEFSANDPPTGKVYYSHSSVLESTAAAGRADLPCRQQHRGPPL